MMKRIMALAAAAVLVVVSLVSCGSPRNSATPAAGNGAFSADETRIARFEKQIGSMAEKDFSLKDLNGKEWKLSGLKGKIVLLNFWATWCGPCQGEMPGFQKLYDRFGGEGDVVVLAVASSALENGGGDPLKTVGDFVNGQKYTFPVLYDADGSVWGVYQQQGVPANYIIDREGNIRLLQVGAFRSEDDLYAALEAVRRADGTVK